LNFKTSGLSKITQNHIFSKIYIDFSPFEKFQRILFCRLNFIFGNFGSHEFEKLLKNTFFQNIVLVIEKNKISQLIYK
jgi:hypothetical protein